MSSDTCACLITFLHRCVLTVSVPHNYLLSFAIKSAPLETPYGLRTGRGSYCLGILGPAYRKLGTDLYCTKKSDTGPARVVLFQLGNLGFL